MDVYVPTIEGAYSVCAQYCSLDSLKKLPWFVTLGLLKPDTYGRSLWCRDCVYCAGRLRSDGCPSLTLYRGDS